VAELARRFPGVPIVCGGEHATALPEVCLDEAPAVTACVLGEGEATAVALVEALAAGRSAGEVEGVAWRRDGAAARTPARPRLRTLDDLPRPRWDLTPIERYLERGLGFGVRRGRSLPVVATRGCPHRCTFCSSERMWGTLHVARSPEDVVDEIAFDVQRYGAENVDLYDLTPIVGRRWIESFCRELCDRRLPVTWQLPSGTRAEAFDAELVALLRAAGCRNASFAPESGSPRMLRLVEKRTGLAQVERAMRLAAAGGINVKANTVIGFPGEGHADLLATLALLWRLGRAGVHDASVWTFTPYPGSALFAELRASGRLARLDDAYYASLLSYSDVGGAVSYDERVPGPVLQVYRLLGLALFYATSAAFHPARPFRAAWHVVRGRPESRSEMSLANLWERLRRG
jgi:radical SAM superfamily enzyme YgiQ (UPF0313 family)